MKKNKFYSSEASRVASDFFESETKGMLTISVCAIMRNEISHVRVWLDNVRSFADEIIVVDTGSQDGTREFLSKQADVCLLDYTWQDDFSKAKNIALQSAEKKWIVFTDADECFEQPQYVKQYLSSVGRNIAAIFCPIDNIDVDAHGEVINSDIVPRIFRNHIGIRYIGEVHEQLSRDGESWHGIEYVIADTRLNIRHTGYAAQIIKAKHQRNYEITLQMMQKSSHPEQYYGFLSESLFGLGHYQEALENAICAIASPYQPLIHTERFYLVAMESMDKLGISLQEVFSIDEAEKICWAILNRNKWHEITLCQWLDMELQNKEENILSKLNELYSNNEQDKMLLWELLCINGYILLAERFAKQNNIQIESVSEISSIYQLIDEKKSGMLLNKLAETQQLLFIALLDMEYSPGTWYQEKLQLLPDVIQTLVCLYHGEIVAATLATEDYIVMLKAVLKYGNQTILFKYLKLSKGMPSDCLKRIGHLLTEWEHYKYAVEILGQIKTDDESVDGGFWLDCGKCLYYLQEYAGAAEAFNRAKLQGNSTAELSAYEAWCSEVMKNENNSLRNCQK